MNLSKPILTLLSVPGHSKHPLVGTHLTLKKFPAIIGRGQDATIVIKHRRLSRLHCRIYQQNNGIFIKDLGSTNGTFLDGERLTNECLLTPGCRISVGGIEFMLTVPMNVKEDTAGRSVLPQNISGESKDKPSEVVFFAAQEETVDEDDERIIRQDQVSELDDEEGVSFLPGSENPTDTYQLPITENDAEEKELAKKRKEHANKNDNIEEIIEKFQLQDGPSEEEPKNAQESDSQAPLSLLETVESPDNQEVVYDPDPVSFQPSPSPAEAEFRKQIEENPAKLADGIHFSNPGDRTEDSEVKIRTGKKKPKPTVDQNEVKGIGGKKPRRVDNEDLQLNSGSNPKKEVSQKELGNFFIRRKKDNK